ncbi:MAG: hypothetical protein WC768_02575 [Patescibacteria group bacterium]
MKKTSLLFLTFIMAVVALLPFFALAQTQPSVYLTLFYGEGCPHCAKEELFLDKLEKEFSNLKVTRLEVWYNTDNAKLMGEVGKKLNLAISGVPLTIIGQETVSGYLNDETTGGQIRQIVEQQSLTGCPDTVAQIAASGNATPTTACPATTTAEIINLPFFGQVNFRSWSLPLLTVTIAALDSFNPCAMWVLLFLISLLFGMENRKRMWLLGLVFLFTSAASYFLFLAAWLNLFLFLGFIYYIRTGIGIFAAVSGIFYLREWWRYRDGGCHVADDEKKRKIMNQLRKITEQKIFWLALVGLTGIAFAVNLIELVCSAGLPAIYSQVLAMAKLSSWQYYLYLLLYVFIYILPSLIVFLVAMLTMQAFAFSTKFARWANFAGGVIILILGVLLIFKPAWIMFG